MLSTAKGTPSCSCRLKSPSSHPILASLAVRSLLFLPFFFDASTQILSSALAGLFAQLLVESDRLQSKPPAALDSFAPEPDFKLSACALSWSLNDKPSAASARARESPPVYRPVVVRLLRAFDRLPVLSFILLLFNLTFSLFGWPAIVVSRGGQFFAHRRYALTVPPTGSTPLFPFFIVSVLLCLEAHKRLEKTHLNRIPKFSPLRFIYFQVFI